MVKIDKNLCNGCSVCVRICPQGFTTEGGQAEVVDENAPCIDQAARACRAGAIITDHQTSTNVERDASIFRGSQAGSGQGYGGGGGGGRGGGSGRGRNSGLRSGSGPGGYCVCPKCGNRTPHQRGVPCVQQECPTCHIPTRKE